MKAIPQPVLQAVGFDDPDALRGFLHGLQHFAETAEFALHDLARPADHLADEKDRDRQGGQAEKGDDRILGHHHDDQANERENVAPQAGDDQIENLARSVGAEAQPVHEIGGMARGEIGDTLGKHAVVHALAEIGDDAIADIGHGHRLAVRGQTLDRVDGDDRRAEQPDQIIGLVHENTVHDLLDHVSGHGGRERDQKHEEDRQRIALGVLAALGEQQARNDLAGVFANQAGETALDAINPHVGRRCRAR